MNNVIDIIDDLVYNTECHYIETLPMTVMHEDYFQLEIYLQNHLQDFANKISRIMIKLIYYYPTKIYSTKNNIKIIMKP